MLYHVCCVGKFLNTKFCTQTICQISWIYSLLIDTCFWSRDVYFRQILFYLTMNIPSPNWWIQHATLFNHLGCTCRWQASWTGCRGNLIKLEILNQRDFCTATGISFTVKPVLRGHCNERPPTLTDHTFLAEGPSTFQYNWTCHQRSLVLTDQFLWFLCGGLSRQVLLYISKS